MRRAAFSAAVGVRRSAAERGLALEEGVGIGEGFTEHTVDPVETPAGGPGMDPQARGGLRSGAVRGLEAAGGVQASRSRCSGVRGAGGLSRWAAIRRTRVGSAGSGSSARHPRKVLCQVVVPLTGPVVPTD